MRTRRSQLGLTGAELAQRAGISPSYVSLIEKGAKVPDEAVAAGLARALEDDEILYRAWARAARLGLHDLDLLNQLEVIARTPAYVSLVESGFDLPRLAAVAAAPGPGGEAADLESRLREVAARLALPSAPVADEPEGGPGALRGRHPAPPPASGPGGDVSAEPAVLRVPVLAEGADPDGRASSSPAIRDHLLLDGRLLGEHEADRLFAYDVVPSDMKRLRGVAAPGDRIVFRRGGMATPDRICAVRTAHRIVLARVLVKDRRLLLLPGEGEIDFDSVEVHDPKALDGIIAGTHVLLIRR
jgi:transcriptional regulator with XRE-family HTH domain